MSGQTQVDQRPRSSTAADNYKNNRLTGWLSLAVGVASGLVLGLWSFDGPVAIPEWLGDYGDVSRRLARLGHIACFGLGIINILLSRELPRLSLGRGARRTASLAMNFGNILLPLILFAAAAYHPLKYMMVFPASSVFLALAIAAYGARGVKEGNSDAHS